MPCKNIVSRDKELNNTTQLFVTNQFDLLCQENGIE
jgi:hypothetical protein